MKLSYSDLHWSSRSNRETPMRGLEPPVDTIEGFEVVGELVAMSYTCIKAGAPDTYRHAFEALEGHGKRRARLLRATAAPSGATRAPSKLLALGRIVDIELDGERMMFPFPWWVGTYADSPYANGNPVLLLSREGVPYAIEHVTYHGELQPYVTPHGIEG